MAKRIIEIAELHRLLSYDPETGEFYRKIKTSVSNNAGDRADRLILRGKPAGYRRITIAENNTIFAHRIAWAMYYGKWPDKLIDHRNGDKGDNHIENLRDVSTQWNSQNTRKPRRKNKSGYLGVSPEKNSEKWRAGITVDGVKHYLGLFSTPELAHKAYLDAKRRLHMGSLL